jgi:uncharacterized protein YbjT (DUF2867 family)
MTDIPPSKVLVVGATGSIGRFVVSAAARHGLDVRALARDVDRARRLLPDADLVPGDLTDLDSLTAAVHDVDAVVFTHGSAGGAHESVDYGGVAGVLRALGDRRARIALMTSINVTRTDAGAYQDLMDWKLRPSGWSGHPAPVHDRPAGLVRHDRPGGRPAGPRPG